MKKEQDIHNNPGLQKPAEEALQGPSDAVNIDALKQAQEHIYRLSAAVEQSPSVIAITNLMGNLEYVNPKFTELTGYTREEANGKNPRILKSGDQPDEMYKELWETISSGKTWRGEFQNKKKNGEIFWEAASISPIFDNEGNIISYIKVAEDISGRREAHEALRVSEEKFRTMMEALNDLVYISSRNFRIEYMNPAMIRRTGHDATGEVCFKALHGLDDKCSWCVYDKIQQGEVLESEIVSPKDNRAYHISQHLTVHGDGSYSKMTVFRDITDQKLAEQQIKSSLKEKEVLLSEVHHRVKNNMQVIISLLKLQSAKIKDEAVADMFKESRERIRSMALIHEKLYQTKDFANVNFREYVKTLSNHLFQSYAVNPDKIRLRINAEEISLGLDKAILCGLILNELISNALKYAFPKEGEGEIRISLRSISQNDRIELTVSDDGIGMPEGIDIGKTESMGLSLVHLLAENQLEGEVELNRDAGTSFSIRFRN